MSTNEQNVKHGLESMQIQWKVCQILDETKKREHRCQREFSLKPILLLCVVKRRNCSEMLKQSRPKCIIPSSKTITNQSRVGGVWFYFLWSTCTSGVNPSHVLKSCSFCHWWCHAEAEGCAWVHWAGTAYWYKQTWDLLKEILLGINTTLSSDGMYICASLIM